MILKWSRRLRWVLMSSVLAYLVTCAYIWSIQRQYVFEPTPELQTTPERVGLKSEEVHFSSGSGTERGELYAWWMPTEHADAPTLLYLHGNDKNMGGAHEVDSATRLRCMGYNLLLVDYRGYGKSTGGKPTEAKVYEDAEAAWNYLIKQRAIDPRRTFIYGHSLGGAIAIDLAAHHPEAAGIIAESTFTSMVDMGKREFPYLPVDLLLNQRFDTLSKVNRLKIPLLLIHGTWDRQVPYQMSQRLYEKAPRPKFLKLIEGGSHGNSNLVAPLEYRAAVNEFVQHYTAKP